MSPKRDARSLTIPVAGGESVLEGVFAPGAEGVDGGALIAAPHPLYGGSIESPVVNEIAWGCGQAGLSTLCFNWRGVGASTGEPSGENADADADYGAALLDLAGTVHGSLIACGYSFGSAAAVRAASTQPRIERLILLAPPTALVDADVLRAFPGAALLVTGESDKWAPPADLEALTASLPNGKLIVVPEADHFFGTGVSQIGRSVASWLGAES